MDAFVISPLPPLLIPTFCAARSLGSADVTPPLRYYGPGRHRFVFDRLPGFAGYTIARSTGFPMGRRRFLQLLDMSLPSCCPYHPAEVTSLFDQPAECHAAFAPKERARPSVY
jgi:hypothetical protein